MIKQLKIENFRCFGKSTLSGFERVNLIGGQNNSGKTAFLEALYLNCSPRAETVMKLRGIDRETALSFPERVWNGLFLDHDSSRLIKIISNADSDDTPMILELSYRYSSRTDIFKEYADTFDIATDNVFASSKNYILELLSYQENTENTKVIRPIIASIDDSGVNRIELGGESSNEVSKLQPVSLISATEKASNRYLAEQYDKCYLQGYDEKVKEAFHLIDTSITEIRTLMSGEPKIYLSRKNQRPMQIGLFGDAINRVAHFTLELINNKAGILLIDEIENGIHHSHQKQLWQWLFALSVELDVQIFAATHSLEMLTAFKKAFMGTQYESEVAYFEFARHVKTQEIIGIKHNISKLDYALSHDGEIRG